MPDRAEEDRIPKAFTERLSQLHGNQFEALGACIQLSEKMLKMRPANDLQQIAGYCLASMTNSMTAVGVLCRYGPGADAIRVARGMFEVLVSLKYLISRPAEVRDYIDFDAVARWRRMQFYKTGHPSVYANFPDSKTREVDGEYERVRERFLGPNGKPRPTWCKHPVSQMAETAELSELYELFYPYASALHHASPMGLAMLVDSESLLIKPAPQPAHIGVALILAIKVLVEAIRSRSTLQGADCEAILQLIQKTADKDSIEEEPEGIVGSLAEIFPRSAY